MTGDSLLGLAGELRDRTAACDYPKLKPLFPILKVVFNVEKKCFFQLNSVNCA